MFLDIFLEKEVNTQDNYKGTFSRVWIIIVNF